MELLKWSRMARLKLFNEAFVEGIVSKDWRTMIVSVHKGKWEKGICKNYMEISFLNSIRKVYAGIMVERVRRMMRNRLLKSKVRLDVVEDL